MRRVAMFHAASVVLHDQDPESMAIYDQSIFSDPAMLETFRNFMCGMYCRSQMSLLTQSIAKFHELSRR
jgi:hypothetical protein